MKRILLVLIALAISSLSFAQPMTGTKYIPGSGGSNDYSTIAAAVTALNSAGVGAGGVTFEVASGYTETLTAAISLTATGTAANPIKFQKVGATANPLITAYTGGVGTPASAVQDGMWNLIGSDYVTIDGIDLTDPNAANPATMEYGYGMFKASVTDGCQYNVIKNCVITLNRENNASGTAPAFDGSRGIVVTNALVTAHTTALTPTSAAGTNSYNQFYSNTIRNCNIGIGLNGYAAASPFTLGDTGNDIGGNGLTTGNTIINFGGAAAATNPAAGIRANNQWGINISYNTINNNNGSGVNHPNTLRGIFAQAGTSASANINYNIVTIKGSGTTQSIYGIDNGIGSTAASNTVNINNNTVTGSYSTATSGVIYAIQNTASAATVNINYNAISGISTPGTGSIYGIVGGSPTALNVNNNNIGTITKTGIGTIYSISLGTATVTCQNNIIDGLSCTAASSTAAIYGFYSGSSAAIENYSNNIVRNITTTGTAIVYGLRFYSSTGNKTVQTNQFYNFTIAGGGTVYGIYMAYGSTDVISDNLVHDFNITGATSGYLSGIYISAGTLNNVYGNNVYALSNAGGTGGTIYGFYIATATTNNVYKNQVYNLSSGSTSPTLYGAYIVSGTTNNFYNNFISDLRTPAANAAIPLAGIYVSGGTTANVFYNSVFLSGTSAGALFGSAALYASTTPTVDMRNNILVNACTPVGATGFAAAYRRSSTTLTTYSANSNGNCFYAGTPGIYNLIMYDGTNSYLTMAAYQTAVGSTKDGISFSVMPPFINAATAPFNLHLTAGATTYCESGGVQITTPFAITDDFDGNTRTSTPDVGADEFSGIAAAVVNPAAVTATVISSQQIRLGFSLNPSSNNVVIVWNATGTFTAPSGAPVIGGSLAGGTVLSDGTTSPVNHTGLTAATAYYYKVYSYDGTNYSLGVAVNATTGVAAPTALTATPFSSSQINLAYTLNAQSNNVIIATNSTSTFGVPANGTAYTAGNALPTAGTVIYVGPLAAFSPTSLAANTAYYYKVWSVDAFNYYSATGITANATTPCAIISTFPYTQSFAASLGCWSASEGVVGSSYHWAGVTSDATHGVTTAQSGTGTYFAALNVYNASTSNNPYYLVSPSFSLGAAAKQVKYYYWLGTSGYQTTPVPLTLQISTNGGSTWTDVFAHTSANSVFATATTSPWTQNTVSLAAYTGTTAILRFVSQSNFGSGYCNQGLDEFVIEDIPSCPTPTALTATTITQNSAVLGWTATGATDYAIEYGLNGFTPTGTPSTGLTAVTNPFTLTGLSSNTAYSYYVRSNCPGSLTSTWAGPLSFTTLCGSLAVPFVENFDSYTVPAVGCGTVIDVNADTKKWATTTGTTYNGANKLSIGYSAAGVTMDDWYITAGLNLTAGQSYDVKFYYRAAYNYYPENLEVKWGTSPTVAGMTSSAIFTQVGFTNDVSYSLGFGQFTAPTTGTYYVGWHCFSAGNMDGIYLDQLTVEATPLCPYPNTLLANNITGHTADLAWTNGGTETSWNVEYGLNGFTQGTGTMITSATNPQHIAGLAPVTAYAYYVRANCGGTYSTWVGPKTFTTLVACPAPTALTATPINPSKESLGWTSGGTSFDIEWGLNGFTPTGTPTAGYSGVGNPVNLAGLTPATTYQYYVRTDCSGAGDGYSAWTGPFSFTTQCTTQTLPYTQLFTTWPPTCWDLTGGSYSFAQYNVGTVQCAYANFWGQSAGATDIMTSPKIDLTGTTTPRMKFDWSHLYSTSYPLDALEVKVSTDNGATWTQVWYKIGTDLNSADGAGNTTPGTFISSGFISLTPYIGSQILVKISGNSGYGPNVYVDNFLVEETPTCPYPTVLTATNILSHSADLGWTLGGSEASWDIQYGLNGFTLGTGTIISPVATNPHNVAGLAGGTAYSFYVRATCGVGLESPWSGPYTFTTAITCVAPTALTGTPGTNPQTQENIGWTDATGSLWEVEYGLNGFAHGAGTVITGITIPSHTLSGLTASTAYQYYVKTDCGTEGLSAWAGPYSFTTACGTIMAPFVEHFNTTSMPACWSMSGPQNWLFQHSSPYPDYGANGVTDHSGISGNFAWVDGSGTAGLTGITLNSPFIDVSSVLAPRLRFFLFNNNTSDASYQTLNVDFYDGAAWHNAIYTWGPTANNAAWQEIIVPLTGYTITGPVQFRFVVDKSSGNPFYDDMVIDDIYLEASPTVPALTVVPSTIDYAYVLAGGSSIEHTYTLSGIFLTAGPVVVTAPANFGVSLISGGPYTTSVSVPYTAPTLAPTTIYTHFAPTGTPTTYSGNITNVGGGGTADVAVAGTSILSYCTPSATTCDEYISDVVVGTISNPTACTTGGYMDYTSLSTNMVIGGSYPITVTNGVPYSTDQCGIWIDWNKNGLFTDAGEQVVVAGTPGVGPYTATIVPPCGAVIGDLRMRVRIMYTGTLSPCGSTSYGESEDYTINLNPSLAHDAQTVSIDNMVEVTNPGVTFTPKATVKNAGSNSETFNVTMTASDGYTSTVTGVALSACAQTQVTFTNWTPVIGDYTVSVCTQLSGDLDAANNCKTYRVKVMELNKLMYAYIAAAGTSGLPLGPVSFNVATPGTLTSIANQSTANYLTGGTWARGSWFAAVATSNELITINPTTGVRTVKGVMSTTMNGLSYDRANGVMYGVDFDGTSTSRLYSIDTNTAVATLIGNCGTNLLINLAINNAGQAYAVDINADVLGTIDLSTGAFTTIGSLGYDAGFAQDMEFDRGTGELYMAAYGTSGQLRWVDKTTGATLKIGNFQGGAEITGFAIPYFEVKTLNGSVMLEGLYNTATNTMRQAQDYVGGLFVNKYGTGIADVITVELHNAAAPHALAYEFSPVNLHTDGTFTISNLPGNITGSYYIVIKHRNSIETWSAAPYDFSAAGPFAYDFTTAATQAYGSNQKLMGTKYVAYGGNAVQDNAIEGADLAAVDNAGTILLKGYNIEDVNGDGIVEGSDLALIDNNSTALIMVKKP